MEDLFLITQAAWGNMGVILAVRSEVEGDLPVFRWTLARMVDLRKHPPDCGILQRLLLGVRSSQRDAGSSQQISTIGK